MQQRTLEQIVNVPAERHRQVPTIQNAEKQLTSQRPGTPTRSWMSQSCANAKEPIITTAQKTVRVQQNQSEDQCRRVSSCSAAYAVRVLMRVRRAWRPQPGDDCSWTVLTNSLRPESSDDDRGAPGPVYRRVQTSAITTETA